MALILFAFMCSGVSLLLSMAALIVAGEARDIARKADHATRRPR